MKKTQFALVICALWPAVALSQQAHNVPSSGNISPKTGQVRGAVSLTSYESSGNELVENVDVSITFNEKAYNAKIKRTSSAGYTQKQTTADGRIIYGEPLNEDRVFYRKRDQKDSVGHTFIIDRIDNSIRSIDYLSSHMNTFCFAYDVLHIGKRIPREASGEHHTLNGEFSDRDGKKHIFTTSSSVNNSSIFHFAKTAYEDIEETISVDEFFGKEDYNFPKSGTYLFKHKGRLVTKVVFNFEKPKLNLPVTLFVESLPENYSSSGLYDSSTYRIRADGSPEFISKKGVRGDAKPKNGILFIASTAVFLFSLILLIYQTISRKKRLKQ